MVLAGSGREERGRGLMPDVLVLGKRADGG